MSDDENQAERAAINAYMVAHNRRTAMLAGNEVADRLLAHEERLATEAAQSDDEEKS